jgi:hypothetical protein
MDQTSIWRATVSSFFVEPGCRAWIIPEHLAERNVARILSSQLDAISWQPVDLFAHIVLRGSTAFVRKLFVGGTNHIVM